MRKILLTAAATAIVTTSLAPEVSLADPPSVLSMFRKQKPVSDEQLQLKVEHGPWLILSATYSGDQAMEQATALAKEIRRALKVPAFVMSRSENEANRLATRERIVTKANGEQERQQLAFRYANSNSYQGFAVLVGEFNSTDDPRLTETLEQVRKLPSVRAQAAEEGKPGPFVTRNPLLPDDYFQTPKVDKFVEGLNRDKLINHSLLDCPGRFTVRVASFNGRQHIEGSLHKKTEEATKPTLVEAADNAHRLTEAMRSQGVEAYEFHDRHGSYVMVGSFDTLGQELSAGQFQYNPEIIKVAQRFCGYQLVDIQDPRTGGTIQRSTLKTPGVVFRHLTKEHRGVANIVFDLEGKPLAVPRAETSKLYSGSLLGRN